VNELDSKQAFRDVVDVDLVGVWNTLWVATKIMTNLGRGGAIVITSSTAVLKGIGIAKQGGMHAYTAARHGAIGLMRVFAVEYAPQNIRVNMVHPTGVNTPMANSDSMARVFEKYSQMGEHLSNALPVETVEPIDITNAVLYLVSDEGRYATGATLPVDAGATVKRAWPADG
jgi:NAD(P)-dependent dehydrogenase (short-subunit alcohol dehydrogenase family)